MRIFSNFRDYYDGLAKSRGQLPVWERQQIQRVIRRKDLPPILQELISVTPVIPYFCMLHVEWVVIFFCGELYCFPTTWNPTEEVWAPISINSLESLVSSHCSSRYSRRKGIREWKKTWGKGMARYSQRYLFNPRGITAWRERFQSMSVEDLCIEKGTPTHAIVFTHTKVTEIINPRLADFNFQKTLNSFRTVQEIEMFLENQLAQQQNPPSLQTDKEKLTSHGFNKHSFRHPTK